MIENKKIRNYFYTCFHNFTRIDTHAHYAHAYDIFYMFLDYFRINQSSYRLRHFNDRQVNKSEPRRERRIFVYTAFQSVELLAIFHRSFYILFTSTILAHFHLKDHPTHDINTHKAILNFAQNHPPRIHISSTSTKRTSRYRIHVHIFRTGTGLIPQVLFPLLYLSFPLAFYF